MSKLKAWWAVTAILLFCVSATGGCRSPMTIRTEPSDAKTYVNEKYVGMSPVTYNEMSWFRGKREVLVMKEGYKSTIRMVDRVHREPATILQRTIFRPAYLGSWRWPKEIFIELEEKTE